MDGKGRSDLPRLILGGAVFSHFYAKDLDNIPAAAVIKHAFDCGIIAIDTAPFYGDSEIVIGKALKELNVPRDKYILCTKAGRIVDKNFDYSHDAIVRSVQRSLERLHTNFLDVVYCHDVEFQTLEQTKEAIGALIELEAAGLIRQVGISGYPLNALLETCKALPNQIDVVLSYCHFTIQNTTLENYVGLFHDTGVQRVLNASPLCMGLLRQQGLPGDWHPSRQNERLITCVQRAAEYCNERKLDLARLATRFALTKWPGSTVLGMGTVPEVDSAIAQLKSASKSSDSEETHFHEIRQILNEVLDWEWSSP